MLIEGRIDEAKLLDMLKGVWERLKNAINGLGLLNNSFLCIARKMNERRIY